jgi:NADH-quinone oxidoreductase subunit H
MVLAAFLISILFLGGWHFWGLTGDAHSPATWASALIRVAVLVVKILGCVLFFMLVRWSWPRFRFDQLMTLAWKVMLPLGVINLLAVTVLNEMRVAGWLGAAQSAQAEFTICAVDWIVALVAWGLVAWSSPLIADNRPQRLNRRFGIDRQIGARVSISSSEERT